MDDVGKTTIIIHDGIDSTRTRPADRWNGDIGMPLAVRKQHHPELETTCRCRVFRVGVADPIRGDIGHDMRSVSKSLHVMALQETSAFQMRFARF